MAAVEVDARTGEAVTPDAPQCERLLVSGGTSRGANAAVVAPVGVGEPAAGSAELFLEPPLRRGELLRERVVAERGQARMAHGVRADLGARRRELAHLGPRERGETGEILCIVRGELRHEERRAAAVGEAGTDENRYGNPALLQIGNDAKDAPERVVERHVHASDAAKRVDLAQQEAARQREPVRPVVGDRVVAEDERSRGYARKGTSIRSIAPAVKSTIFASSQREKFSM